MSSLKAEKLQLEVELKAVKERAINEIIEKEKKIIDLINFNDEQQDSMKREN